MPLFCRLPALLFLLAGAALSADDLFEDYSPGLLAQYAAGGVEQPRVDADVAFIWGQAAPIATLRPGEFTAVWTGVLLVKSETNYRFSAYAQGRIKCEINGQTVITGEAREPGWIDGPTVPLEFGFLPIRVSFEKTTPAAQLQLFWSSEQFPLEPLPQHLLFHQEDDSQAKLVERGRVLFDAHRCNRCHIRHDQPMSPEGPPLIAVAADLNPDWLEAKLQQRHPEAAHAKMPNFGFNDADTRALAAWLWHINAPPDLAPLKPATVEKKNPPPDGLTLVRSVGCLACHTLDGLGESGPFGGGDLSRIGGKRTADWLYTWLNQPDRINPDRLMPVIKLTPTERSQIAAALAKLGHQKDMTFERPHYEDNTVLMLRGRELSRQVRCFNCHKVPAAERDVRGLPTLDRPVEDWSQSCLAETPDVSRGRPSYPQADTAALRAYVETLVRAPAPQPDAALAHTTNPFLQGRLLLEQRNCLGCHERDGGKGIVVTAGQAADVDKNLRGLSEALIPPRLTAVGDKLHDAALAEAVGGDQKTVRMPWLKVRMPKFNHTEAERAALVAYLIGHDRIPDRPGGDLAAGAAPGAAAPATGFPAAAHPGVTLDESESLLLGRKLVGTGGFSCIACHKVGDYEPRNTALGTRGSDLKGLGDRMREEFFIRWTRAPLRIVPGMEMPSYDEKPVRGVLNDDVHQQLAALWTAVNNPRFEPPTNPAQVEQLLVVRPGDPPRVLRDVFTVSKENGGGYVPRAFAVGFDNGHSLLFDLDRACLRDWTFGEFARQRTEGKSWYWDLAGAPLVSGLDPRCEFHLQQGNEWIELRPEPTVLDVERYSVEKDSVTLNYALHVPGQPGARVEVRETWRAVPTGTPDTRRRLTRNIQIDKPISGGRLWFVPAASRSLLLAANVERDNRWQPCGQAGEGVEITSGGEIHYLADSAVAPSDIPPRPELPLNTAAVTTLPGFEGQRLPLPTSIMPTAMAFGPDGTLGVTSLKGHLYILRDSNADGLYDSANPFDEGLAAPFGVLPGDSGSNTASPETRSPTWLVVHKPEMLAITDLDGDGRADDRRVVASGWGYTDNYHDWSAGPVRDAAGNLYVATSSDYAQPGRPEELCKWRGKVLKIDPAGTITPIAHELRYPMGIAFDSRGRLFVSDQQGVANCFNEIDHIVDGARYGVKGLYDPDSEQPEQRAAIQIPHPWTRSVNGIFFIPETVASENAPGALAAFAGHGIGCEYNGRFLIRFSLQEVGGQLQGATYPFSRGSWRDEKETFLGPICGAVAPNGDLYIGSILDSGWLGGMNIGEIVRLRPAGERPNGIREIRALSDGFEIEFLNPVDRDAASRADQYALSGYTRVWQGSYATDDSGQYQPKIQSVDVSADGRTVRLKVDRLEPSYVYDVAVRKVGRDGEELFPDVGYYTMNRIPGR